MPEAPRVSRIEDIGPLRDGIVLWHPLRRELGVTAFGVNAFSAETPGERVIEEHDELGPGAGRHEELYVVLTGHATFVVDDAEIDAPAGTLVLIPDPASRRGAHAVDAGTVVLVVGAAAGQVYEPSPWEASAQAALYARGGDPERARAAIAESLEHHPDHGHALYNVACAEALLGEHDAALEHLARAVELEPKARKWMGEDDDLASIRGDARWPG